MEYSKIITFILLSFCWSCINHQSKDPVTNQIPKSQNEVTIELAEGFSIQYDLYATKLITNSIGSNSFFSDTLYIVHDLKAELPAHAKILPAELNSICSQSATHLAFLNFFDELGILKGLCGKQYVHNSEYLNAMTKAGTKELCLIESLQLETLLEVHPDLYFIYPFESAENEALGSKGVKTFMIAEYLELHPLARLEWIKLFGVLFQQESIADDYYNLVKEDYLQLVQKPDSTKQFIMNLPFGDNWNCPSANSLIVTMLEDAGLYYYFQNEKGTENVTHPNEQIWEVGGLVDYWIIIADRTGDFDLDQLKKEQSVYGSFKSVQQKQVIFCNSNTSDYFLDGVLEPHIMLKDILFATKQIEDHQPKYFHLLK